MNRLVIAVVVLAALSADAKPLRIAVLPLQPTVDATPKNAAWIEGKLLRELRRLHVDVVTGKSVTDAMTALGTKDTVSCDVACLTALGKRLAVERVIAPSLMLQHHFTKEGTAWTWRMVLVDVATGAPLGVFEKLCLCPDRFWDDIARHQVERLVMYDPKKEVALPPDAPKAAPTAGPHDEPGMVFVPAGPFVMGTDRGEWDDEAPRHVVDLSAYYIDKTETTNADWQACVAAHRCPSAQWRNDKVLSLPTHPVVAVNWHEARAFCAWKGKRLPTEAEWEKAARGTDEREFPWGDTWNPKWLNHKSADDGFEQTAPVGSFPQAASPYGALDMAGNLWEWTNDVYGSSYYRKSPSKDPTGPAAGPKRAMRGGSWMYDLPFFHTAHNRSPGRPDVHKKYVGFRCVKAVR